MKLWLISQDENQDYDTYDSAIVAAETEEAARNTLPYKDGKWGDLYSSWVSDPSKVTVILIGEAAADIESGVILASFNAG